MTMVPKYLLDMPAAGIAGVKFSDEFVKWDDIWSASISGQFLVLRRRGVLFSLKVPLFPYHYQRFRSQVLEFAPLDSEVRIVMRELKECPTPSRIAITISLLLLLFIVVMFGVAWFYKDKIKEEMEREVSPLYAQIDDISCGAGVLNG